MAGFMKRLAADRQGATIVEFALVLPPLLLTLMGLLDMAHNMYTAQILNGAVQQAARDSTIEGTKSSWRVIDAKVTAAARVIAPGANVSIYRVYYQSFTDIGRPEDWTDMNNDGTCNNGEPFEDVNFNGRWDKKPGRGGIGAARDAVLYNVKISYPRLFPIAQLIPGQSKTMQMETQTILRNQPYSAAQQKNPATGNCK